jgi:hypothetical protein
VQAVPTTPTDTTPSVPANHIDLESNEAQKLLDDAFNSALGKEVKVEVPVVKDTPKTEDVTVVPPEVKPDKPTEVSQNTKPSTETVAKEALPGVPDWAKDLPKEVQEKVLDIANQAQYHQQRWRSDVGRQSALQSKLTEARRELASLKANRNTPQNPAATAATGATPPVQTTEEWKQIIEADPSLAKAIESRIQAEVSQAKADLNRQIDANIDPLYQHTMQTFVEEQQRILRDAIPNVDEVLQSPVYKYWINNVAAPGIKQLAETSTDSSDAINVMRIYANDAQGVYEYMVRNGMMHPLPSQQQVQQQAQPAPQQVQSSAPTLADKVAKVREQKVHAAPVVPTAPVAAPTTSMATSLASSKPGQQIDLDDDYVKRALEEAYNQYKRK